MCHVHTETDDPAQMDVASLSQPVLDAVEADVYWCLSKLLDLIQVEHFASCAALCWFFAQDNYTFAQKGIQAQVQKLEELTRRLDRPFWAGTSLPLSFPFPYLLAPGQPQRGVRILRILPISFPFPLPPSSTLSFPAY